ncbi:MAG: flagellar hook-length control protein FliK [Candidatus Galacturonibacter soehngenii]|nr:flagellar hook-length control protein FliK [Candidatus Galacturonibacter soehngenii]
MEISYSNISSNNQTVNASEVQGQAVAQGKEHLQAPDTDMFRAGTQFKGEILDIKGLQVSIGLENGQVLNARLEASSNLTIGQQVAFEVESNTGTKITIKPADLDYKINPVLQKALQEASLPITQKNLLLVNAMLKEGLSINKQSLTNMLRQLNMNQGVDIDTLVKMDKLGIEVTKENITQFENYKNYEHRIVKEVGNVLNHLSELINEVSNENTHTSYQLQLGLIKLLQNEPKSLINEPRLNQAIDQNKTIPNIQIDDGKSPVMINEPRELKSDSFDIPLKTELIKVEDTANSLKETGHLSLDENLQGTDVKNVSTIKETVLKENVQEAQKTNVESSKSKMLSFVLNEEERYSLSDTLKRLGVDEVTQNQVREGKINNNELMNQLKSLVMESDLGDNELLFHSKEYVKVLKQALKEQWLVTPQDLKEPDKMTRYYKQLEEQTKQLSSFLEKIGKEASPLMKDITNIRSNLNFMEQINQNVTYLQIPIQFSNQEAHSDLYVYTNKKSLRENNGNLSVLLHLDMEVLGMTDIYINMKGNQVSAKFNLQDNKAMELVANNLAQLVDQLKEKGYQMSASVGKIEKEPDFVEDFLEKDKVSTSLKRYAFDVRT